MIQRWTLGGQNHEALKRVWNVCETCEVCLKPASVFGTDSWVLIVSLLVEKLIVWRRWHHWHGSHGPPGASAILVFAAKISRFTLLGRSGQSLGTRLLLDAIEWFSLSKQRRITGFHMLSSLSSAKKLLFRHCWAPGVSRSWAISSSANFFDWTSEPEPKESHKWPRSQVASENKIEQTRGNLFNFLFSTRFLLSVTVRYL